MEQESVELENPFLKLPEELHDFILQHLNGADLLRSSEVCHLWYNLIAISKISMQKITQMVGFIDCTHTTSNLINIIKTSPRRYINISIFGFFHHNMASDFIKIIKVHCKTIENLDLRSLTNDEAVVELLQIPNLHTLSLISDCEKAIDCATYSMLLKASNKLKSLKIDYISANLIECLESNNNLITLNLSYDVALQLFEHDISEMFHFKLQHLITAGSLRNYIGDNFIKFLLTQANNLQSLQVEAPSAFLLDTIFNELTALRRICFKIMCEEFPRLDLSINEKITELEFQNPIDLDFLKSFLIATPNIEVLIVKQLDLKIVDFITRNLKKLKKVYYFYDFDYSTDHYYDELLQLTGDGINKHINFVCSK